MRSWPRVLVVVAIPCLAVAVDISAAGTSTDVAKKPAHESSLRPRTDADGPGSTDDSRTPTTLGPAPHLAPIQRFIKPIDPWIQSGLGWGDAVVDDVGAPGCSTNRRPTTSCDPAGPRPFVHTGFDALPAPDRTVKASAVGQVVFAGPSFAPFAGEYARMYCERRSSSI